MKPHFLVPTLVAALALAFPAEAATKKKTGKVAHRTSIGAVHAPRGLASDPHSVYVSGEYIGRDPDPNIRAYMRKSPHDWDGPE